jgi:hypothetical protein
VSGDVNEEARQGSDSGDLQEERRVLHHQRGLVRKKGGQSGHEGEDEGSGVALRDPGFSLIFPSPFPLFLVSPFSPSMGSPESFSFHSEEIFPWRNSEMILAPSKPSSLLEIF